MAPHAIFLIFTTPELFGVKEFLTLSDGWANPYDIFAQQRESKFSRNNAIISSKGISANDVGWSSGYVAWGGYMKIKPQIASTLPLFASTAGSVRLSTCMTPAPLIQMRTFQ